jgi:sugar phosphate permease
MLKLNAAWFPERLFGTLAGSTILMGNMGALLAATPLAWALGLTDWRSIFVGIGITSLLLAIMAWLMVRDNPLSAGLPSMRQLEGREDHPPHSGHWLDGVKLVVTNPLVWPGFFVNFGSSGAFFAFGGLWAVPLLTQGHGLERTDATYYTSLLLIGFALGAFFIGGISDRIGRRKPVLIAACALHLICWAPIALGLPVTGPLGYLLFLLMGIGASGFTLTWACAKEVNRHALSGTATSLVNTGGFLGAAILQPLVGWTMDRADGEAATRGIEAFQSGMLLLTGFVMIALIAALFIRETRCQHIET